MVESLDFSLGIILGVIITFVGNCLTEKWRESKEKKSVGKALITELEGVKKCYSEYQPSKITISIFSTVVPKLLLFKKQTVDAILETYREINWRMIPRAPKQSEIDTLTKEIDNTIKIIEKELGC